MSQNAGSAALQVQQAIYRQLTAEGSSVVTLTSGRIYDAVPDNAPFPYVSIGELTETDKPNTQLTAGRELVFTIHVFSRAKGMAEMQGIADAIVNALEDQQLDGMPNWVWTLTSYDFFHTMREMDGITRHGVLRFRVRVSRA